MEDKKYFYYLSTKSDSNNYLIEYSEQMDGDWRYPGKDILVIYDREIIERLTHKEFKKKYGK